LLTNGGHIAPGNPVGNLKLNGNFIQSGAGTLDIEFATCAAFDTFTVTGTAALAGTLHVTFQGCAPVPGNAFTLLTAAGVSGTFSSLVVSGGPPGVVFTLSYTATSVVLNADVVAPPVLQGAVSRKVHGAAGAFNLPLSIVPTNPSTEPRQGPAQTIVLSFDKPVTGATATITEGIATAAAPAFVGTEVVIALSGVIDRQYVTVSLTNVGSADGGTGGSASARIGFLVGDVNGTRVVSVADLGFINAQLAQVVTVANFLKDVNASGSVTVADKGITNANLTMALPAP
jgi:hypothetical protein